MVTQANNVVNARSNNKRRIDRRAVQSLARIDTPPDTLPLTTALQTTLDLDEMLGMFKRELTQHVQLDGLIYRNNEHGLLVQQGMPARHRASYGLTLAEEQLGDITLNRNTPFSEQDLAMAEYLLCPLLYPLRNALRYQSALTAAYRDPLTGVHNRAALEEAMPREIELARRHELPLSLLLIDLDHFKRINDTYGHSAGDCALRTSTRHMLKQLRATDRVFRYGGEEFAILLTATDEQGASVVAERIRAAIADGPCECEGQLIPLSASIGYTVLTSGDTRHTLFDKADKALYRAKSKGRNQVVIFD